MESEYILFIGGGEYADERGTLSFFNGFDMSDVKRFYIIEHQNTNVIRAWQGHRHERKWFHVISGIKALDKILESTKDVSDLIDNSREIRSLRSRHP